MQPATEETVLGNFDQARVSHRGGTTTFFRRDGKYLVRTEGPDGKPGEFEIAYTFGVTPLQQYLVPFPDGRIQALGLAWDTRPHEAGGANEQRHRLLGRPEARREELGIHVDERDDVGVAHPVEDRLGADEDVGTGQRHILGRGPGHLDDRVLDLGDGLERAHLDRRP